MVINMNNVKAKEKIRTVTVNERGQIVIPEELRDDMKIEARTTLVLIGRGREILLRKESDFLASMEEGDWKSLSAKSLESAWDDEDKVWDEIARNDLG